MPDTPFRELNDLREIRQLKARFFRLLDAQDWDGWRALFAEDMHVELPGGRATDGADAFVAFVRETTEGARGVRHGHTPEVAIDGPDDAHGTWAVGEYVEWPPDPETGARRGWQSYGHHDDTYRRVGRGWRIAGLRVTHLRVDPLPPEPIRELRANGLPPLPARPTGARTFSDLLELEAIEALQARYLRLVDAKDWQAFRRLFADDAEFVLMDDAPMVGADAFVEFVSGSAEGTRTVHHGHLPELTLVAPGEAQGSWELVDYVEWPPDPETGTRRGRVGYGRYDVGYRKVGGEWKVARWALSYARNDRLPRTLAEP
jgi:ketosteroid isomerase-like protein